MSALFSPKKRTPLRTYLQDRRRQDHKTTRTRTQHQSSFSTRKSESLSTKNQEDFKKRPSSSLCQTARGSGATSKWGYFFLQKGTHHAKISRSATRFRSRKHSDDACSCSTRLEGTRRGFQNSTMKCSAACRYGTHRIPHKEGKRPRPIRILFL